MQEQELEHPTAEDHLAVAGQHTAGHKVVEEELRMSAAAAAAAAAADAGVRRPAAAAAAADDRGVERSWDGNSEAVRPEDRGHDAGVPDRAIAAVAAAELEGIRQDLTARAGQGTVLDVDQGAGDRMAVADAGEVVADCIRTGLEPGNRAYPQLVDGGFLCLLFLNDHHGRLGFDMEDIVDSHPRLRGQEAERVEEGRNCRP